MPSDREEDLEASSEDSERRWHRLHQDDSDWEFSTSSTSIMGDEAPAHPAPVQQELFFTSEEFNRLVASTLCGLLLGYEKLRLLRLGGWLGTAEKNWPNSSAAWAELVLRQDYEPSSRPCMDVQHIYCIETSNCCSSACKGTCRATMRPRPAECVTSQVNKSYHGTSCIVSWKTFIGNISGIMKEPRGLESDGWFMRWPTAPTLCCRCARRGSCFEDYEKSCELSSGSGMRKQNNRKWPPP